MKNRKLKITEMGRMNVEEFRASEKMPLIIVLDDVRSMYNVGSVFRTADAFRVEAIYLCGITAQPPHPEIHKTALGAEDTVAWQHFPTALEAVASLKQQGYTVYSIEQCEGSTMLNDLSPLTSQPSTVNCQLSTPTSPSSSAMKSRVCIRKWLMPPTVASRFRSSAPNTPLMSAPPQASSSGSLPDAC